MRMDKRQTSDGIIATLQSNKLPESKSYVRHKTVRYDSSFVRHRYNTCNVSYITIVPSLSSVVVVLLPVLVLVLVMDDPSSVVVMMTMVVVWSCWLLLLLLCGNGGDSHRVAAHRGGVHGGRGATMDDDDDDHAKDVSSCNSSNLQQVSCVVQNSAVSQTNEPILFHSHSLTLERIFQRAVPDLARMR